MKNNYLLTGLFMAVMLMVSMPLSAGTYSGGDGLSSSTPYQIATTDDLIELSNTPGDWGAYFIQTADIAFDSDETLVDWDGDGTLEHGSSGDDTYGFSPIGDAGFDDNFTGSYDGNEKTISNLFINRPDDDYIGLFGGTDGGATISNIGVTNVDITALSDVGGLVGWNYDATVSNSYTTGSVHAEYPDYGGYNVGGIVGVNGGTILNSYSTASVSGYSDIGGLVGNNDYGTISKCYAAGSVSGTGDDISGLVGSGLGDDVDDSFWDTETSGQSSSDGGTGKTTSKMKDVATFTDETNTTGLDNAWDFVTNPNDDNADNDYWDMDQEGTVNNYYPILSWQNGADDFLEMPTYSGGDGSSDTPYQIASINDLIALSNYYTHWDKDFIQTANITFNPDENQVDWNGDGNAGPAKGFSAIGNSSTKFTGEYDGDGYTIDNLYMNNPSSGTYFALFGYTDGATITDIGLTNVNITGSAYVGGLVGLTVNSSNVSNSYITGSVSGSTAVGGLVGYNENSTVSNCYSTCSMSGGDVVGGLVGYRTDSGTISNCYSTGSVNGDDVVGGLVGVTFRSSTVSKCYSTGNVSGSSDVGGLVGENYATINNSYSTGNVTRKTTGTTADIGGFCGCNESTIENCYSTGNVYYEGDTDPTDKGFVGVSEQTSYTANFFDSEASNQSSATGATGKTTAKMTDDTPADNIYLAAGWDFAGESTNGTDDIWNIGSGYNSGYPFHSWEHPEADTPLPVTLVYFDACYVNGTINLNWQTASETENLAFRIYRDEEMIAEVEGAGTTSEPQNYTYTDQYIIPGRTYTYVLADVDLQSKETKHPEVEVEAKAEDVTPDYNIGSAYPNPFNPQTIVPLNLATPADVRAFLYDLSGRMIRELYNAPLSAGSHDLKIDGSDLSTGIYLLQVRMNDELHVQKIALMK